MVVAHSGGRTGMRGRGHLYRWGPNHASDPVIVRCLPRGQYQVLMKRRQKHPSGVAPGSLQTVRVDRV